MCMNEKDLSIYKGTGFYEWRSWGGRRIVTEVNEKHVEHFIDTIESYRNYIIRMQYEREYLYVRD